MCGLACVAGFQRGGRRGKTSKQEKNQHAKRAGGRERDTCKDAIVFFIFYVQDMGVKILIGQIFIAVKILLLGGVTD